MMSGKIEYIQAYTEVNCLLKYKYWSNSSEKAYLMKKFYENEKAFRQEMSKRYNTDNLFQKTRLNEAIETSKNVSMIKYEASIFSKILGRLKGIFRR